MFQKRLFMTCLLLVSLLSVNTSFAASVNNADLWRFIEDINDATGQLTVSNVDRFPLALRRISHNEYVEFYRAEPVRLAEDLVLTDFDVRLSKTRKTSALLSFGLRGRCLPLGVIKQRYRGLIITQTPRGHSLEETTSYTWTDKAHHQISFLFTERNPDCLHEVVIDRWSR